MKSDMRSPTAHRTKEQASRHWSDYGKKHPAKNKARLKARRQMIRAGLVRRGDGKDVDHKDGTMNNARSNLRVQSPAVNRAHPKKVAARGGRATKKSKGQ